MPSDTAVGGSASGTGGASSSGVDNGAAAGQDSAGAASDTPSDRGKEPALDNVGGQMSGMTTDPGMDAPPSDRRPPHSFPRVSHRSTRNDHRVTDFVNGWTCLYAACPLLPSRPFGPSMLRLVPR